MKKDKAIFRPLEAFKNLGWYSLSSAFKKSKIWLTSALCGAFMIASCGPIKEIPVKTEIIYRDSIRVETKVDTLEVLKTKIETVRDYSGLLDTLRLSTANAEASAWIDTTHNVLKGELKDKDVPVQVAVPSTNEIHYRDSIVYQDRPYPVEVTKEVRIVPRFWTISGVFGIICFVLLAVFLFFKIKTKFKI
jgi:hypothetical protein